MEQLVKFLLWLHTKSYNLVGRISSRMNKNIHPKHSIINYEQWFIDNIDPSWVVLDVGCNRGIMTQELAKSAKYVYGIEIVKKHIIEAKQLRQSSNLSYIHGDATTYDYSDFKSINCITLSNVLEHIEERIDFLKKLISNVQWVNCPLLLIRVPTIEREWITVYKKNLGIQYLLDSTHHIEYTKKEFFGELEAAGLKIDSFESRFGEYYAICTAKS